MSLGRTDPQLLAAGLLTARSVPARGIIFVHIPHQVSQLGHTQLRTQLAGVSDSGKIVTILRDSEVRMTDVVKSAYMIDPSDGLTLVKREEAGEPGGDIDREYWQRVNQVTQVEIKDKLKCLQNLSSPREQMF